MWKIVLENKSKALVVTQVWAPTRIPLIGMPCNDFFTCIVFAYLVSKISKK